MSLTQSRLSLTPCSCAVYAVWPASVVFLVVFTLATQHFSRGAMFNITIGVFLACFTCFGLACPFHEQLHLAAFAERSMLWVPSGKHLRVKPTPAYVVSFDARAAWSGRLQASMFV